MTRPIALLLVIAPLVSCERPVERTADRELAAQALQGVLLYPRSVAVSASAGEDAARAVFSTPAPVKDVAAWYRETLKLNRWQVKSDQEMADGVIALYAEREGRPLWITLQASAGGLGTTYTLVGTLPGADSAAAQPSGSSMSSNRIQRR